MPKPKWTRKTETILKVAAMIIGPIGAAYFAWWLSH